MTQTNIPDPDCGRCHGVGWYEGGKCLMTDCGCLVLVSQDEADCFVTNGSLADWTELYQMARLEEIG